MIQEMWSAASAPRRFFMWLETQDARILRAFGVALASYFVYTLCLALAFVRSSGSDAYLPIVSAALGIGAAQVLFFWGFGGLSLQRPGALDVRAWEVAAWSWTPAAFVGLSLLPAFWLAPLPAALLSVPFLLVWHLVALRSGLQVFLARKVWWPLTLYVALVLALPLALFGGLAAVFSGLA